MTKTSKLIAGLAVVAGFGVAVLPLASYAETRDVTISVVVDESASIEDPTPGSVGSGITGCTSGGTVTLSGLALGTAAGKGACAIKVSSNDGHKISIIGSASSNPATNLVGASGNASGTNIATSGTNFSSSLAGSGWSSGTTLNVADATATWGFNVAKDKVEISTINSIFAVPTTSTTIETTSSMGSTTYTFGFAVTAPITQPDGTYAGQVTLTVETN
jgi:hypothetical protein